MTFDCHLFSLQFFLGFDNLGTSENSTHSQCRIIPHYPRSEASSAFSEQKLYEIHLQRKDEDMEGNVIVVEVFPIIGSLQKLLCIGNSEL